MVEQFMRVQRGEPTPQTSTALHHKVTPARNHVAASVTATVNAPQPGMQRTGAPPSLVPNKSSRAAEVTPTRNSITEAESVRLRMQQLAVHNISSFRATEQRLSVIVSEEFLERYFPAAAESLCTMGIDIFDCPLQQPVSVVIDAVTAMCVVSAVKMLNRDDLKVLVKSLCEIAFKFAKIHLLVVLDDTGLSRDTSALNKAMLTLTQAVSKFPAAVYLRQCSALPHDLAAALGQACSHALREAVTKQTHPGATSARYFHRPFLQHLQECDGKHLAHCEYLQLFPSVNFYTAAVLLYHHPLSELVGQRVGALCDLFERQYVFSEALRDNLKNFVALLEVHAGLELPAQIVDL